MTGKSIRPKIFIWHGQWQGGTQRITLGMAEAFKKYHGINPVLGVFEKIEDIKFEQIVCKEFFPKKLVSYNILSTSLYLNKSGALDDFGIVFAHGPGFWKKPDNFYTCHESGDLDTLQRNLPPVSSLHFLAIKWLLIRLIKTADLVIPGTDEASNFLERHGIKNYVRSSSFVDTKVFRPYKKRELNGRLKLLFVGRQDPTWKNTETLKRVCRELKGKVHLDMVGSEGEDEENIHYFGKVSEQKLVECYNAHDLFVLPSVWEGFSIALLEAMACETPVLASEYAVPKELKKYALRFNPYDVKDLKAKILWAIKNYDEMLKVAKEARKLVVRKYDKEYVTKKESDAIMKRFLEVQA